MCGVASRRKAVECLEKVTACMPEIKSVQMDEGSEFRGAFEEKALELGLTVYVLPPRGVVERFNRTLRDAL